jgi:hypothetical protein
METFQEDVVAFRDGSCILLVEGLDGVYKFHLQPVEEVFKSLFATIGFRESREQYYSVPLGLVVFAFFSLQKYS